jgi:hypothetical protein
MSFGILSKNRNLKQVLSIILIYLKFTLKSKTENKVIIII